LAKGRVGVLLPVSVVTSVALLLSLPKLLQPVSWLTPDAFFYEAQVLEIRGMSQSAALREVSTGSIAAARLRQERAFVRSHPGRSYHVGSARWMRYVAPFFRRRWVVPLIAAALFPLLHERSLYIVTILGYVLYAPLLYLLLKRRFATGAALLATLSLIALPMFRSPSMYPGTDTFGVAMEVAALLMALLVLDRGYRWLPAWVAAMAALAFTRDATVIPLGASFWLFVRERTRPRLALLLSGMAVAIPPLLLFGVPLRQDLAFTFNGFDIPTKTSWSSILAAFPSNLKMMVHDQVSYLVHSPETALVFAVGIVFLYRRQERSLYLSFMRAAGVASVLLVYLIPQLDLIFRLELATTPMVAVGVAAALEPLLPRIGAAARRRMGGSVQPSSG